MKLFLLPLAAALSLQAESLSVGVRGGLPVGDAFTSVENRDFRIFGRNRFVIGPTVELRLPAGLGFSFDIFYRRYAFESETNKTTSSQSAAQWEFPLMFRYRFPGLVVHPFVGAGPTFNRLTGVTSPRKSTQGLAIGAGLDIKIPFFHITPEFRYSRLFQQLTATPGSAQLTQNQNRWDLLVGLTF